VRLDRLELRIPPLAVTGLVAVVTIAINRTASCLDRFQIQPEERMRRQRVGREFDDHLRKVRRWLR
jgi:protein-S-isoprenylcysteine O-methyltransferase Ste14